MKVLSHTQIYSLDDGSYAIKYAGTDLLQERTVYLADIHSVSLALPHFLYLGQNGEDFNDASFICYMQASGVKGGFYL